jgi:diguanylate cyclase (GGDEF)-like protein
MARARLQFAAAISRLVVGVFALTVLPLAYPGMAAHRSLFVGYLVYAVAMQVLIWRNVGGIARAVVGGLVDMAMLTFIVHRIGSAGTMMVAIYFFAAIVNTLVVGRRVGVSLAAAAAVLYCGVVVAEVTGVLVYGPDAPGWVRGAPSSTEAVVLCVLFAALLVASAWLVGVLVQRIRTREQQLVDANARLSELSVRDPLTQLFNRRHLVARLEDELARVRRGHPLAVVMIDLDGFKRVNDERGHPRGDEVLREIAAALDVATREVDVVGRYGGDEFIVLLPDAGHEEAAIVSERLVEAVRRVGHASDPERPVTASIGVALARPGDASRALIARADELAYRAKQGGGDRAAVESAELDAVAHTRVRTPARDAG